MFILEKPYIDEERINFIVKHNHEENLRIEETPKALYALEEDEMLGVDEEYHEIVVKNPEWISIHLQEEKSRLISENDNLRDITLNGGVLYRDVLFDSDTDQKINLFATYNLMSDEDTIILYGMNNAGLLCNKDDLMNIGQLIIQLHSFCWTKNATIKNQIEQAESVEELENIEINYTEETNDITD